MRTRSALISTLLGVVMLLVFSAPAAAAGANGNLLAAVGVTFGPDRIENLTIPEPAVQPEAIPEAKFAGALAGAFAPRQNDPDKHHIGGGLRTGGYSYGIAGMLRFWFNDIIFFDASIGYHAFYYYLNHTIITLQVGYTIKRWDEFEALILRLYVAGGIDILHWSYDANIYGATLDNSSVGGHGVVGVEILLKQLRQLGFGAEAGFYSRQHSVDNFGLAGFGGFGSGIYAVWYFK